MDNKLENLKELIEIIAKLRSPEGCPWDIKQTHKTLRENMIEEAYEAVDAIDADDSKHLKEELGDVLLQVILHAQIAEEHGEFSIADIAQGISEKLIRRHPHVFGDVEVSGVEDVLSNWDEIKKKEKPERLSALSGISKSQSALMRASELSKKAVKVGFEWPNTDMLWECLTSELEEFKEAVSSENKDDMEDEFGDILFTMVNIARWYKLDPELALNRAGNKFKKRFQKMEAIAEKPLPDLSFEEYDELWKIAKRY